MLLHGARAEGEQRRGRREGNTRENQRHPEVRCAGRAALVGEERQSAQPLEGPENESSLNDPRRPRAPHEEKRHEGQDEGDERETSGRRKCVPRTKKGESRWEEARGHAG